MDKKIREVETPLSASEHRSALFRQRGVPCIDSFTLAIVGSFRSGLGYDRVVDGNIRKFLPTQRWITPKAVMTMWTIEPAIATMIIRGNSTNVAVAKERHSSEIEVIEPMGATTHMTTVMADNELKGRWAGWLVWILSLDDPRGLSDAVCMNCNLCATTIMFSIQSMGTKMIHLIITPESIRMLASYARNLGPDLGVSTSITTHASTKLLVQPVGTGSRSSCTKLYGNGSMQICGHSDVENLIRAHVHDREGGGRHRAAELFELDESGGPEPRLGDEDVVARPHEPQLQNPHVGLLQHQLGLGDLSGVHPVQIGLVYITGCCYADPAQDDLSRVPDVVDVSLRLELTDLLKPLMCPRTLCTKW